MPKETKKKNDGKAITLTTKSQFGSHKSMLIKDLGNGRCICKDDIGEYETLTSRLDSGLADPKRYSRRV